MTRMAAARGTNVVQDREDVRQAVDHGRRDARGGEDGADPDQNADQKPHQRPQGDLDEAIGSAAAGDAAGGGGEAEHDTAHRHHADDEGQRRGRADVARQGGGEHEDPGADDHVEDGEPEAEGSDRAAEPDVAALSGTFELGGGHALSFNGRAVRLSSVSRM